VAFTPGLDFGHLRASQNVRLAYTQQVSRLEVAVARIRRGLETWVR
jgi:aspartate/methionine/tyrosine aminotransferase